MFGNECPSKLNVFPVYKCQFILFKCSKLNMCGWIVEPGGECSEVTKIWCWLNKKKGLKKNEFNATILSLKSSCQPEKLFILVDYVHIFAQCE